MFAASPRVSSIAIAVLALGRGALDANPAIGQQHVPWWLDLVVPASPPPRTVVLITLDFTINERLDGMSLPFMAGSTVFIPMEVSSES